MNHSPCWMSAAGIDLADDMPCRLLACDASEHRTDRHPDARKVPLPQDIARHDLPGRKEIRGGLVVLHHHLGPVVHYSREVCEGDAGPKRVREEWGCIQ